MIIICNQALLRGNDFSHSISKCESKKVWQTVTSFNYTVKFMMGLDCNLFAAAQLYYIVYAIEDTGIELWLATM